MLGRPLEHDPEKWEPVFGKDHAQAKCLVRVRIPSKWITLWVTALVLQDQRF
jgi:hypothetical protein